MKILLAILLFTTKGCFGQSSLERIEELEFENILNENQTNYWQWRSEASNDRTLRLEDVNGVYRIVLTLCAVPIQGRNDVKVTLDDIFYANDGPSDQIIVQRPGSTRSFVTVGEYGSGFLWNRVLRTGQMGEAWTISSGNHTMTISVRTDQYGLELDMLSLWTKYQQEGSKLVCNHQLTTAGQQSGG